MKHLVSQYHALKIEELARGSWLHPASDSEWVWRTNKGTEETTVRIIALMDSLSLVYRVGLQPIQNDVELTYSAGPRGGKRPWFKCPMCRRRVGVLYHADNENLPFRCRICCELAYPSQYQSHDQSYGRRLRPLSHKERDRLMSHHTTVNA